MKPQGWRVACRSRWVREAGGIPPIELAPPSGRYLSFSEREEIALLWAQDHGVREIARRLGVSLDHLARTAPECNDSWWYSEVSGHSRAVESRESGRTPEGRQTCRERTATNIRAEPIGRNGSGFARQTDSGAQCTMEGATARPAGGSALGRLLESRTDQSPIASRLS